MIYLCILVVSISHFILENYILACGHHLTTSERQMFLYSKCMAMGCVERKYHNKFFQLKYYSCKVVLVVNILEHVKT